MAPMIGILAGMGPKSTAPFISQFIDEFQKITGAKNDIDFPHILIYSLPTPFYVDRPIDHKLMEQTLCEGLKKLEACGVSFIAIACNSAHIYFHQIKNCIHIPLLNIIDETTKTITAKTKKIAILGTTPTIESNIYQEGLKKLNLENLLVQIDQVKINELIKRIKDQNKSEELLKIWESISRELKSNNIDTILLACTELNVLLKEIQSQFHIIDSSVCLIHAMIDKWKKTLI